MLILEKRPWRTSSLHKALPKRQFEYFMVFFEVAYRAFSLTWPASMHIYCNKRKRLHKKRIQLPQDWFGTPTWPPFHCFGTPIGGFIVTSLSTFLLISIRDSP